MKKIIISGFILTCLFCLASIGQAKNKVEKTYAFGFAASFNDSTVYFTDIQELDSTWLDEKGFLQSRENYSYQLRDYLANQGMEHRTCIITYSTKLKDTKKKFTKLMGKYTKGGRYDIRLIKENDFRFKCIKVAEVDEEEQAAKVSKKKKDKKKRAKKIKE